MCVYNILAKSTNGYVILCNQCNHYQMAFGTTAVTFKVNAFKDFCEYVICLNDSITSNGFDMDKRIKVDLLSDTAMMILNYKELKQLFEIICEAKFNLEVEDTLHELNLITE